MRLATFNVLHGLSLADGRVDPRRLTAAATELHADVLALQEVDRGQPRSGHADQAGAVARAIGARDWRFQPALVGTPGQPWRAAVPEDTATVEPSYGVALVSCLPVRSWHVVALPAAPVRAPVRAAGSRRLMLLDDEPRVGLAAVVAGPAGPVTVATTHLSFVPGWNVVQLRRLVRWLRGLPEPQLLLGDLNLPGPLPKWLPGWRSLVEARTYPAPAPTVQLDHVLARGQLPPLNAVEVRRLPLSDHRAVVVELPDAPDYGPRR